MSNEFNNPLDNSDVPIRDTKHSAVGGMFQSIEQAHEYKLYLENLKLYSELTGTDAATGGIGGREIQINVGKDSAGTAVMKKVTLKDLVPKESEFERVRRVTIAKLNGMADEELRVQMARFGTDNVFELSARITAYLLDKKKRDEAYTKFDAWKP
jgi:hypothetical protein